MLYNMETQERKIQTAFRLRPSLLERVKREAGIRNQSVNAYVETVLEQETELVWPKLPKDFFVSDEITSLRCCKLKVPSAEELAADPKLNYLWNKYGKTD